MHVYLSTLGCRLNEAELETWARGFRAQGHDVVAQPSDAQVIVFNTCAVTTEAARKSRKLVAGLHRQNPSANLVVTGCFAELEPERAAALVGVDMVVGNRDKSQLVDMVTERFATPTMPVLATEPDGAHVYQRAGRTRAFVKVQDGCRNRCTFCVVTIARGEERSRTIDEVVAEIRSLHAAGYREAVLTGVHLGGYGTDLDTDLQTLVANVLARTAIPRIRLSSLEPWDLPADFWQSWDNSRLMPHLHLPLQSGSDTVLRRMARRCSATAFRQLVDSARDAIPDLTITTDLIVGFPGETEHEWSDTVKAVRSIGFGHMHIFTYSPRQGTKAARLAGQIRGDVKRQRSREVHQIAKQMKRRHLARFVGSARAVLWEGEGVPIAGVPGEGRSRRFTGYTDNYLRVQTVSSQSLSNQITMAHLRGICDDGERLDADVCS